LADLFKKALDQVLTFLDGHDLRYAIIGGVANQIWGEARFTYDIDIKVLVPDTDYGAIRRMICEEFPEPARAGLPVNPLIISVLVGEITVDFLMTIPGYDELLVTRAQRHLIDDLSLWICTAEDLIIQKAIAGRPKDWQDIEGIILEQNSILDWQYIENWLIQFADALEDPEILHRFQAMRQSI